MKTKQSFKLAILLMWIHIVMNAATASIHRVPADFDTIKSAVQASVSGDTVLVSDGTYSGDGNTSIGFEAITVMSENGPHACIIDCGGASPGFVFQNCDSATKLQGFTITRGYVASSALYEGGSAVRCISASPIILDCIMHDCSIGSGYQGGVVAAYYGSSPRLINCLIYNNQDNALGSIEASGIDAFNCTLTENTGYSLFAYFESSISFSYSIAWPYTQLMYWESSISNNNSWVSDPLFCSGPKGGFYLSQTQAGQSQNSPCIDIESAASSDVCIIELCLDEMTTRSDGFPDTDRLDMGFHYRTDFVPSTPTPSATPTSDPTDVPTATPTSTASGVTISLNDVEFEAGERFELKVLYRGDALEQAADLYVVLQCGEQFFFWPEWSVEVGSAPVSLSPDVTGSMDILDFIWPEGDFGSMSDLWIWSLLCYTDSFDIMGNSDSVEFGFR